MLVKSSLLLLITLILGGEGAMASDIVKEIQNCPKSPNCVSSLTDSKDHFMSPWPFKGEVSAIKESLKEKVLAQNRVELISEDESSLHFVFTSWLMRYKDDVWFYFDAAERKIHFKSASRIGYSDLGANAKRMKQIKSLVF